MSYNVVYQSQGSPPWYEDMMKLLAARAQAQYVRRQEEEGLGNYRYPESRQAEISPYTREILLQIQRRENSAQNRPTNFQLGTRHGSAELDKLYDLATGVADIRYDIVKNNQPFPSKEEFKRLFKQRTGIDFPANLNIPADKKELHELANSTSNQFYKNPITQMINDSAGYPNPNQVDLPKYEQQIQKRLLEANSPLRSDELQGAPVKEYQESVENALREQSRRNYDEFVKPQLTEQFVRAGQYGSRRHGDLAEKALASQTRDLDQRISHLKYTNYLDRLNAARENRRLGLQSTMGAQQHAGMLHTQEQQRQQEMLGAGEMERAINQQKRDIEYQDWLRQKQSPEQNLATLSSQIAGITPGTSYMQQVQQTPPAQTMNTAGMLGSLAGQAFGARRAGLFRNGGLVRRYY
jgi:hypothetical protein